MKQNKFKMHIPMRSISVYAIGLLKQFMLLRGRKLFKAYVEVKGERRDHFI